LRLFVEVRTRRSLGQTASRDFFCPKVIVKIKKSENPRWAWTCSLLDWTSLMTRLDGKPLPFSGRFIVSPGFSSAVFCSLRRYLILNTCSSLTCILYCFECQNTRPMLSVVDCRTTVPRKLNRDHPHTYHTHTTHIIMHSVYTLLELTCTYLSAVSPSVRYSL
jgi:hypothetical protein